MNQSNYNTITTSIVIPVFNQVNFTKHCLETLYAVTSLDSNFEVIIIDNASTDGTAAYLTEVLTRYSNLHVLTNSRNEFFAGACNRGAEAANGDVLVFLNNDTEPLSGWLEHGIIRLFSSHTIGIVGAKLLYADRTVQHCGIEFVARNVAPYYVWPEHRYRGLDEHDTRVNYPGSVDAVTGACLFIRRNLFMECGGFDVSYGMYSEDTDLCFKVRQRGLDIFYEPQCVLFHYEAKSSPDQAAALALNSTSQKLFYQKWGHEAAERALAFHIEKIDGIFVHISKSICPTADSESLLQCYLLLQTIPSFYLHFGGAGDALLLFSTFYDHEPNATLVSMPNSPDAMKSLCEAFPLLKRVYILPHNDTLHAMLRAMARQMPKCLGMGITPEDYNNEWNDRLDLVSRYGVSKQPLWATTFHKVIQDTPQIVVAPKGSIKNHLRNKRNIIHPKFWHQVLTILKCYGIRPLIIGTPDEEIAYPAIDGSKDCRSFSFREQMELISGSQLLIAADSWHKTFAALAGVTSIVFQSVTGEALRHNWKDSSEFVFIDPWEKITLVHDMDEFERSFVEWLTTGTIHSRNFNPPKPLELLPFLTSFDPAFWKNDYQDLQKVLIRSSSAIGDSLNLTAVVAEMKRQFPHLKLFVSGGSMVEAVFRHNHHIAGFVPINSNEELNIEGDCDVTIDYTFILDRLVEYINGIGFMDIFANIAGIKISSYDVHYTLEMDEALWAAHELAKSLQCTDFVVGLQFTTAKDIKRCYPNGVGVISGIKRLFPNACFVLLGLEPLNEYLPDVYDCARQGISFRKQMALATQCDAFVTIDSAFFHVGHNLCKKPTLLIAGPTNPLLIGSAHDGFMPVQNTDLDCLSCYWRTPCNIECMQQLSPDVITNKFKLLMADSKQAHHAWRKKQELVEVILSTGVPYTETLLKQLWNRKEPVTLQLIDPHGLLPAYAYRWNGLLLSDAYTFHKSSPILVTDTIVKPPHNFEQILCPFCQSESAEQCRTIGDIVRCRSCTTVYLRTRMKKEAMEQLYQSYQDGESHLKIPETDALLKTSGLRRDYFLAEIMEFITPHGTILDIGCGWGAFLDNARSKGFIPQGVELTGKGVDFANKYLGISVAQNQFLDITFESNSIAVVTMLHVFEHLPEPYLALKKVFEILEPGGMFCGIVPNFDSYCSNAESNLWQWLDPDYHYVHYTPATLTKHLNSVGFVIERLYTVTGDYGAEAVRNAAKSSGTIFIDETEFNIWLKNIEHNGQGEEIRFFARKPTGSD